MSIPEDPKLRRKTIKNRTFIQMLRLLFPDAVANRLHGKIVVTYYDGEIKEVEVMRKIRHPEEEIARFGQEADTDL